MDEPTCRACGMMVGLTDFHPYPACVMFRQVRDGDKVEGYLRQIIGWGRKLERYGLPNNAKIGEVVRSEQDGEQAVEAANQMSIPAG